MKFIVLIVIILMIIYEIKFRREYYRQLYLTFVFKTKQSKYAKLDKTKEYKKYITQKVYLDFCRKHNILKEKTYKKIFDNLSMSGYKNPEEYMANFTSIAPLLLVVGSIIWFICFVFKIWNKFIPLPDQDLILLVNILLFLSTVAIIVGILILPILYYDSKLKKKHTIWKVEQDYYKLFSHLYYYYSIPNPNYLLAQVLEKFTDNCSKEMRSLVDKMISTSKQSDELAIKETKQRYSQSIKIVNLMDKLQKCVEGNKLGPEYLKGLYNELIEEEDYKRTVAEQHKQSMYLAVLTITILIAVLSALTGMTIEIMFI